MLNVGYWGQSRRAWTRQKEGIFGPGRKHDPDGLPPTSGIKLSNSARAKEPISMAGERVQRKLAAILAADVVGYSRLMGTDEAGTRARLMPI
jgi:class 3 adenylate cyclase